MKPNFSIVILKFRKIISFRRNYTYYVAGYVCRGLITNVKCKDCRTLFSNGEVLPVQMEDFTGATAMELRMGNAFIDAINRGGLVKPSDLAYISCLHAAELYSYIIEHPVLQNELISSKNSRALFVAVFLQKLDECENTKAILQVKCKCMHTFDEHCRQLATVLFNLFAKNLATEYNNVIHQERKRAVVNDKRDLMNMKVKKLNSYE